MSARVQVIRQGKVESDSRNLRGLLDYARRNSVHKVHIMQTVGGGAVLTVTFFNGATCETDFASFEVCKGFIKARQSWALDQLQPVASDPNGVHVHFTARY